jgi:cytochrome c
MNQKDNKVTLDFQFKGEKGQAELQLVCQQSQVRLQGSFRLPDRSGDWIFTKLQNAKAAGSGKDLFTANCSGCHFPDRKDTKVGPGLQGLFKRSKLPVSGLPVNEETVGNQIVNGGRKMPPFKHLKEEEIKAIIDYLKSL